MFCIWKGNGRNTVDRKMGDFTLLSEMTCTVPPFYGGVAGLSEGVKCSAAGVRQAGPGPAGFCGPQYRS